MPSILDRYCKYQDGRLIGLYPGDEGYEELVEAEKNLRGIESHEIGLSLNQRIRETCFSGYINFGKEKTEAEYFIVVEIATEFSGAGTLEIVVLTDGDDGFYTGEALGTTGPLSGEDLWSPKVYTFHVDRRECEPHLCLQYKVTGTFEEGAVTTQIGPSPNSWWLAVSTDIIECKNPDLVRAKADGFLEE